MNPEYRKRILGLIIAALFVIYLGEHLVVDPLHKGWKARSDRIVDLRRRTTQGAMLIDRETALRQRWSGMRTNALSREPSVAESQLLNAFYRWSKESGVSVSSIRPVTKELDYDALAIECRADAFGDLASLTRFLYLIEKDTLGVKVDNIELSARDNRAQQLNLVILVSGLVLPPAKS